jgi:hypothetical protein
VQPVDLLRLNWQRVYERQERRTDCKVLVSDDAFGNRISSKTIYYEWQKSNVSVRSWTMEMKQEHYNIKLAFVWRKQQV